MNVKPLVSICCQTYNHKNYITQAIEGFLMQKTNFPFEILLRDDASTDGTTEIVKKYAKEYPDLINPLIYKENQYVKGVKPLADNMKRAKGKYIAICEGDDYWTDPCKLQTQVGFLETHPDYSLCFHNALVLWEDKSMPPDYFCPENIKETTGIEDIIRRWYIPTASMVFKKEDIYPLPEWSKKIYSGDWLLQLLLAEKGKIKYFNQVMSIYRKAVEGSMSNRNNASYIYQQQINLLQFFNSYSGYKQDACIQKEINYKKKMIRHYRLKTKFPFLYYLINPKRILRYFKSLFCSK